MVMMNATSTIGRVMSEKPFNPSSQAVIPRIMSEINTKNKVMMRWISLSNWKFSTIS